MASKIIKVHVNKRLVEVPEGTSTIEQLLVIAGYDPALQEVRLLQGEGDVTGGTLLDMTSPFVFENGQHFRVLPADRNLGSGRDC